MTSTRFQVYLWTALIVPTVVWWADSILWVALMSDYALILAALAADNAKKAGNGCNHHQDEA